MKERGILFNGEMVRAILDGRKTVTRRAMKPQPTCTERWVGWGDEWATAKNNTEVPEVVDEWRCPYGQPGDRLYVCENAYYWGHWTENGTTRTGQQKWRSVIKENVGIVYQTDGKPEIVLKKGQLGEGWIFRPAMFMPRWAARTILENTDVRVERVQEIQISDILKEGIPNTVNREKNWVTLWDSINDARGYSWESNPWVWVIEFKEVVM